MSEIIEQINAKYDSMSKGHKAIARFILNNAEQVGFMKLSDLSHNAGVSEATVLRFVSEVGFDGYHAFIEALNSQLRNRLTSIQRLNYTDHYENDSQAIRKIIESDVENLNATVKMINDEAFEEAINLILGASKIYLMGLRSSAPLAEFMQCYMSRLFDDVVNIKSNSTNEVYEQILPINSQDVMIGISFPRYSNCTINSIEYAKKKGAKVIVITDTDNTLLTQNADVKLFAKYSMASFVDSLTAPLSLINALLVTLGMHRKDHITDNFKALEELWSMYGVYDEH